MDFEMWWKERNLFLDRGMAAFFKPVAKRAWDASRENMVVWDYEDIKKYYYSGNLSYYQTIPDFLDYLKLMDSLIIKEDKC